MPWDAQLINAYNIKANSKTVTKAIRRFRDYKKYVANKRDFINVKNCKRKV